MGKLERLRESCTFPNVEYTILKDDEAEKRGIRLSESVDRAEVETDLIVFEAKKLRESLKETNDLQILDRVIRKLTESGATSSKKLWRLPIGRYGNMNGNKRIYTKKLWENVRDRQQDTWKGIAGLMDHPERDDDPGKARDQAVVWLDMDVPEGGIVYGIGRFVGPYGQLAQEIIEAGGRCGFSSSGFGDVNKITKEVDPETYVIERLADIVINPSQDIYGSVDCAHTPEEFMSNVNGGAVINFSKPTAVREAQSAIIMNRRINEMADVNQQNAATQTAPSTGAAPAATAAPAQDPTVADATQQAGGAKLTESVKSDSNAVRKSLSKAEERIFRKHIDTFLKETEVYQNPITRLNECREILSVFEEGACPDLKEKLEEQIKEEEANLEKLVEETVDVEKTYGIGLKKLEENAQRITHQGLMLNEQVSDYKELCEALTDRNRKLLEDNKKLRTALKLNEKIVERAEVASTKKLARTSTENEKLIEEIGDLEEKNSRLMERLSALNSGNKQLEKDCGEEKSKLATAVKLLKSCREAGIADEKEISKLKGEVIKLNEQLDEVEKGYEAQSRRLKKLQEAYEAQEKEIRDNDPKYHVIPKASERVGKFLNLRENRGAEVEDYWTDLLERYGESVKPFEDKIRNSKTLREATNNFLKYRREIDSDFAVAEPVEQYAYRNRAERSKLLEHQGIPVPGTVGYDDVDAVNADFLDRAKRAGLR
jgi:hypothetical protein